ncbi:MAG: hypothetical protein KGD73_00345 [Candidatus Lokiarchaeota archaeon]|nr:hypothetical protein [Candidatus Lokiarchaeota archaeon]
MKKLITPEKILIDFNNGLITKEESINLLESILSESEDNKERLSAIETVGYLNLNTSKSYELLEKSLISDESPLVRVSAAQILMQNFSNLEKNPLLWAIENEDSVLFFKPLLDLFEEDDKPSLNELKDKTINKLTQIYNLQYPDMKFIIDVDYIEAHKFLSGLDDFTKKFGIQEDYRLELIKENTSISNKGLARINASIDGHIIKLTLKELNHIPLSINSLPNLNSLTIDHCTLKNKLINGLNFPDINQLIFTNNNIENLPDWVWKFANNKKAFNKFIKNGVVFSEAPKLALIEILTGKALDLIKKFEKPRLKKAHYYKINELGHITGIYITNDRIKIGIIPHQLCNLKRLEELHLVRQNISNIPKCIINLKNLKILNLSFNNIENLPENIEFLNNLEHFDLRSDNKNVIKRIPQSINLLTNLKVFNLSGNVIENLPNELKGFKPLKL